MPLSFGGGNDGVVMGSPSESFSAATVTAWIYSRADSGDGDRTICTRQEEPPGDIYNQFVLRSDGTTIEWRCRQSDGSNIDTDCSFSLNTWTFLAGTVANSGKIRLYKNGVQEEEQDFGTLEATVNPILIGADRDDTTYTNFWEGEIADVRVYNRELTAIEIMDIYVCRGKDKNMKSLVMRCPLSDATGTATSVMDIGPNKYSSTMLSSPTWYYPGVLSIA